MAVEAVKEAAKDVHAPEQRNVEAEKANIKVWTINGEAEEAEAEKGPCYWDNSVTEKDMAPSGPMLSDVPSAGYAMEKRRIARITKKKNGLKRPSVSYVETN